MGITGNSLIPVSDATNNHENIKTRLDKFMILKISKVTTAHHKTSATGSTHNITPCSREVIYDAQTAE